MPAELRRAHGLIEGEPVALVNTPDGILIKPVATRCVLCGSGEHLVEMDGPSLCEECIQKALLKATVTQKGIGKAAL